MTRLMKSRDGSVGGCRMTMSPRCGLPPKSYETLLARRRSWSCRVGTMLVPSTRTVCSAFQMTRYRMNAISRTSRTSRTHDARRDRRGFSGTDAGASSWLGVGDVIWVTRSDYERWVAGDSHLCAAVARACATRREAAASVTCRPTVRTARMASRAASDGARAGLFTRGREMALLTQTPYKPKTFDLSGLTGISDHTLEVHFGLYAGYVKNTNLLNEQLVELLHGGKTATPAYAEMTRRLGFEYNGMVLHEWYFGNMKPATGGEISSSSALGRSIGESFGDIATWKQDFSAVGAMRGVGWAVTYLDPATGRLSNHWITLHEDGNIAGFKPIIVMDVWEHAFLLDYKPAERPKYIESFLANLDVAAAEARLGGAERPIG